MGKDPCVEYKGDRAPLRTNKKDPSIVITATYHRGGSNGGRTGLEDWDLTNWANLCCYVIHEGKVRGVYKREKELDGERWVVIIGRFDIKGVRQCLPPY